MTKAPRLLGTWLQIILWQDQSELLPVSGSQGSFIFLLQVELQRSCCQRHCSRSFSHGVVWKKHDPLLAFASSILPVFLPRLHPGYSDCSDYSTATGARRIKGICVFKLLSIKDQCSRNCPMPLTYVHITRVAQKHVIILCDIFFFLSTNGSHLIQRASTIKFQAIRFTNK